MHGTVSGHADRTCDQRWTGLDAGCPAGVLATEPGLQARLSQASACSLRTIDSAAAGRTVR